jgi:hypothetical protein
MSNQLLIKNNIDVYVNERKKESEFFILIYDKTTEITFRSDVFKADKFLISGKILFSTLEDLIAHKKYKIIMENGILFIHFIYNIFLKEYTTFVECKNYDQDEYKLIHKLYSLQVEKREKDEKEKDEKEKDKNDEEESDEENKKEKDKNDESDGDESDDEENKKVIKSSKKRMEKRMEKKLEKEKHEVKRKKTSYSTLYFDKDEFYQQYNICFPDEIEDFEYIRKKFERINVSLTVNFDSIMIEIENFENDIINSDSQCDKMGFLYLIAFFGYIPRFGDNNIANDFIKKEGKINYSIMGKNKIGNLNYDILT